MAELTVEKLAFSDVTRECLTDGFMDNLGKMKATVEKKLEESQNVNRNDLPMHFNDVKQEIREIQLFISDSTKFLPSFNVQVALKNVKTLLERLELEQETCLPKKKFGFRKNKNLSRVLKDKDAPDGTIPSKQKTITVDLQECGFKNLKNENGELLSSEINGKDVVLSDCSDCTIHLYGYPSTVHINGLKSCCIYMGPVTTSVFVEACTKCTFRVACQQLRVHSATDCDFYLHVTSRGIVEDCKGLRFATYDWSYPEMESDFQKSGLSNHNNWQQIDDFNWLSKDVPSPNWCILKKEDAVTESGDCPEGN